MPSSRKIAGMSRGGGRRAAVGRAACTAAATAGRATGLKPGSRPRGAAAASDESRRDSSVFLVLVMAFPPSLFFALTALPAAAIHLPGHRDARLAPLRHLH